MSTSNGIFPMRNTNSPIYQHKIQQPTWVRTMKKQIEDASLGFKYYRVAPRIRFRYLDKSPTLSSRPIQISEQDEQSLLKELGDLSEKYRGRIKTPLYAQKILENLVWLNENSTNGSHIWNSIDIIKPTEKQVFQKRQTSDNLLPQFPENHVESYVLKAKNENVNKLLSTILSKTIETEYQADEKKKARKAEALISSPRYMAIQNYLKRFVAREIASKTQENCEETPEKVGIEHTKKVDEVMREVDKKLEEKKEKEMSEKKKSFLEVEWPLPQICNSPNRGNMIPRRKKVKRKIIALPMPTVRRSIISFKVPNKKKLVK